jgi:hypothetical protein
MTSRDFLHKFMNEYKRTVNYVYAPVWAKEQRLLSLLKRKLDDLTLMRAIETFFEYPLSFWGTPVYSVFTFSKNINAITQEMANKKHKKNPHLGRFKHAKRSED